MKTRCDRKINWPDLARKAHYSASELAALCGFSVRELERKFLRSFGQTPRKWITHLRLRDATALLVAGRSVKQIAVTLKYKHAHSFSRVFKQYFGVPPSGIDAVNSRKRE